MFLLVTTVLLILTVVIVIIIKIVLSTVTDYMINKKWDVPFNLLLCAWAWACVSLVVKSLGVNHSLACPAWRFSLMIVAAYLDALYLCSLLQWVKGAQTAQKIGFVEESFAANHLQTSFYIDVSKEKVVRYKAPRFSHSMNSTVLNCDMFGYRRANRWTRWCTITYNVFV